MLILGKLFGRRRPDFRPSLRHIFSQILETGWGSSWVPVLGLNEGSRWGYGLDYLVSVRRGFSAARAVEEYWDFTDDEWEFEEVWKRGRNLKKEPESTSRNWKLQGNLDLMEELGMTQTEMRRMVSGAKAMTKSRPSAVNNKIEWCKDTLDMDEQSIKTFLLKNPWLLNYSSQIQLRPFTSVVLARGMDSDAYRKMVVETPDVLRQAKLGDISRVLDGFADCGFTVHQFLCMAAIDASISRRSCKKEIKPMVRMFLDLGLSRKDFVSMVPRNIQILDLHNAGDFGVVLDRLLDYGLTDEQTEKIRKKHPNLIGSDLERQLNWWT